MNSSVYRYRALNSFFKNRFCFLEQLEVHSKFEQIAEFLCTLCPPPPQPSLLSSTSVVHSLQSMNLRWHIVVTQIPYLTLWLNYFSSPADMPINLREGTREGEREGENISVKEKH